MRCTTCSPIPPTPAPTSSAGPASERYVGDDGVLRTRRRAAPEPSGRCSSPTITAGSSTGTPTRPTRPASAPTSAPRAPAGHRRGPGRLRAAAGPGHLRGLRPQARRLLRRPGTRPPPATTAPAPANSSTAGAPATCASAASRSTPRSPRRSWPRCTRRRCRPAWPPPNSSRTATTPRSTQWRRQVETARYQASKAERRYRAVDPENRLVARGLETDWEHALQQLADAEAELARRESSTPENPDRAREIGHPRTRRRPRRGVGRARPPPTRTANNCCAPCSTKSTSACTATTPTRHAELVLRWKGGAISELTVPIKRNPPNRLRTDEDTIDLRAPPGRALPRRRPSRDILNRQGRRTARGLSFTASRVQSLRHHHEIPCHQPSDDPQEGELLTVADAAAELGLAPSTLHRWLERRVHRRRATHPRRALADPAHRRHPRPVRRRRPRRLAGHAGGHPRLRRVPPNHHATCQARRTPSRPRAHRTPKRPAYPAPTHPGRTVLTMTINERSSVTMHPRTPGCQDRSPSPALPAPPPGTRPPHPWAERPGR